MSGNASVNEILTRIQAAAQEKNVDLTYTNMRVYLMLLDYAKKNNDIITSDHSSVRFYVTTLELVDFCSVAPRTITESLRKLKESGIIKYATRKPKPSVITLFKAYYE